MPATSRLQRENRAFKFIKKSKKTRPENTHRFESFTARIEKLTIDPVRRSTAVHRPLADTSTSHFKESLDEWQTTNLTDHFSNFVRAVGPLSESLPQLLHHRDRIADSLLQHVRDGSKPSLEPLLDLVGHFARDLGPRFEAYFERSVRTLSTLASSNEDLEIVEWALNSIVWLFKYLSRLVVPDLRPTYNLIAPLLGKEKQKPFITRFAAEAFAFLLRKAGVAHTRDPKPLRLIISHILADTKDTHIVQSGWCRATDLLQNGHMTLFAESIRGVQRELHTAGLLILKEVLQIGLATESGSGGDREWRRTVMNGLLVALAHHCDEHTFAPVVQTVLDVTAFPLDEFPEFDVDMGIIFLLQLAAVCKGTRVTNWLPLLARLQDYYTLMERHRDRFQESSCVELLASTAVLLQNCPLDAALPVVKVVEKTILAPFKPSIISFFYFFARLGSERFKMMLLPTLRKFVALNWQEHTLDIILLALRLRKTGILAADESLMLRLDSWGDAIAVAIARMPAGLNESPLHFLPLYQCSGALEVLDLFETSQDVQESLVTAARNTLHSSVDFDVEEVSEKFELFKWQDCFRHLCTSTQCVGGKGAVMRLASSYAEASVGFGSFWHKVSEILRNHSADSLELDRSNLDQFARGAIICLTLPSHELRLFGLETLASIYKTQGAPAPLILEKALAVEESPFNMQTQRHVSAHIRKIGALFKDFKSDAWLCQAIPAFCFGLLHVRLSSVWDDSCATLKEICEEQEGQGVVVELALQWLRGSVSEYNESTKEDEDFCDEKRRIYTDFECPGLAKVVDQLVKSLDATKLPEEQVKRHFERVHERVPTVTISCRAQALRVLQTVPQVAERRSRVLVPLFLEWTNGGSESNGSDENQGASNRQSWSRKDQKALVSLFASFTNPRALYQSEQVYTSLLHLVSNGDVDIQKPALNALLTWKEPALERYKDDLLGMLDDDRFREQLSVFLDVGNEDCIIQQEHCEKLMSVVLRILYGRMISKTGSSARGGGLQVRRKAALVALTRFDDRFMEGFLDIALGPLSNVRLDDAVLGQDLMAFRKQHGLLNMLKDMLTTLGTSLDGMANRLVHPLLFCLFKATANVESGEADGIVKAVRHVSLQCLTMMFELFPGLDWTPFLHGIFERVVDPKIAVLPIETAHSISGMLKLFSAWSASPLTATLLSAYNEKVLIQITRCFAVPTAKEDVKMFILRLLSNLVEHASETSEIAEMLRRHGSGLLHGTEPVLRGHASKSLLDQAIATVSGLAPYIPKDECLGLVEMCSFLLQQPANRVAPKIKSQILHLLRPLLSDLRHPGPLESDQGLIDTLSVVLYHTFTRHETDPSESRHNVEKARSVALGLYNALSLQFSFFRDRESRHTLGRVFAALSKPSPQLHNIAALCEALNSISDERLDEPDFERRFGAFDIIRDCQGVWSAVEWVPVVHNLLWYIRDEEDGIRANASLALRRFVEAAASKRGTGGEDDFMALVVNAILPAIQNGIQKSSELLRVEYLAVLAHLIKCMPGWETVSDMQPLLVGNDEEASFFSNILHIQQHRRLRALRRLAKEGQSGTLSSANIGRIFVPLVEAFIFDPADNENAHNLAAEAISTIGILVEGLEWLQYRAVLKRYTGYIESKPDDEKNVMRLLSALADALTRAKGMTSQRDDDTAGVSAESDQMPHQSRLFCTMPQRRKLTDELEKTVVLLTAYLHHKDEATVSRRVPVALTITKILIAIPAELDEDSTPVMDVRLPPVLMDLSNILRARAQDSRDLARRTLADITALTGPSHLHFILKELRRALKFGYQLHVLSYTVHSILISTTAACKTGDLDYCINDIVSIIMDDIFGVTGQEKDAQEYIGKMKEVKGSKSFDSMELVASITTLPHIKDLVGPTQVLLQERLDDKMIRKIDELLRRLRLGLARNEAAGTHDILVLCYEIWNETYKKAASDAAAPQVNCKTKRYLVNMRASNSNKSLIGSLTTRQNGRIVRFAIEVLRDVIPKHEALQSPANLKGLLSLIGDAIVSGDEDVKTAAFRLVASIIRVVKAPFPQLDEDAAVYAREAMRIVRDAHSTQTESAQAALRMATEVVSKRRGATIREGDVAFLLKAIKPDLEQPSHQGAAFGFLRAVVACKIIIPEVYEIMDTVAAMMVTNQTRESRKLARDAYFEFLMDYPQAKGRLDKQIAFLVKNLGYQYVEGRQSVMEALHLLLTKVGDDVVGGLQDLVFLPLVLVMVNDEAAECRASAAIVVMDVFERAAEERMRGFEKMLLGWLQQDGKDVLRQAGLRCWAMLIQMERASSNPAKFVQAIERLLDGAVRNPDAEQSDLVYYALKALKAWALAGPRAGPRSGAFTFDWKRLWELMVECQFFPHPWVKFEAAQMVGLYLEDAAKTAGLEGLADVPLKGSAGLVLDARGMTKIARANLRLFGMPNVAEELVGQATKNLAFLGKCFALNGLGWPRTTDAGQAAEANGDDEALIESDDDDDDEEEEEADGPQGDKSAIAYMIERLSAIVRSEPRTKKASALVPQTAALQLLGALVMSLPETMRCQCVPPVLRAVHNLTDPIISHPTSIDDAFTAAHGRLQDSARELMANLQSGMGTEAYLEQMAKVKKAAVQRREERRTKRRIEAVTVPERFEERKRRRREGGRERKKAKNAELRGRRRGW